MSSRCVSRAPDVGDRRGMRKMGSIVRRQKGDCCITIQDPDLYGHYKATMH